MSILPVDKVHVNRRAFTYSGRQFKLFFIDYYFLLSKHDTNFMYIFTQVCWIVLALIVILASLLFNSFIFMVGVHNESRF